MRHAESGSPESAIGVERIFIIALVAFWLGRFGERGEAAELGLFVR